MKTYVGRWAPMVLVPTMAIALAGCSGDDDDKKADAKPSAAPTSTATSGENTTTPGKLPTAPRLQNAAGGVADVKWDQASCETAKGTQTVEGTVTNPGRRALDYVITVSWTNDTSDTRAAGIAVVRAAQPKRATDWTLKARVPDGATQCVINVMRGRLASRG